PYATLLPGFARVFCSFFAGVLFYRLHASGRLRAPVISPLLLAAVLLGLLAAPHALPWVYDVVCIFLLFPLILVAAMNNEPTARWTATARVSADLSYPLYLFHLPLLLWLGFVLGYLRIIGPMQMAVMLTTVPGLLMPPMHSSTAGAGTAQDQDCRHAAAYCSRRKRGPSSLAKRLAVG